MGSSHDAGHRDDVFKPHSEGLPVVVQSGMDSILMLAVIDELKALVWTYGYH